MIELADKIFPRGHSEDIHVFAGFYTLLNCPAVSLNGRSVLRTEPTWKCFLLTKKIPSDTEYAGQRFFVENYALSPGCDDWRIGRNFPPETEAEVLTLPVAYQPRTAVSDAATLN